MRSAVRCMTSVGTSIFRRSARKSVCQVGGQAQVPIGEAAAATFQLSDGLLADAFAEEYVEVVEVVVERSQEGEPVSCDRRLDVVEHALVEAIRGLGSLE